jgi:hypothetical protein
MSITKKSLISNRSAAKKAVTARKSANPNAASIKAAPLAAAPRKHVEFNSPRKITGTGH